MQIDKFIRSRENRYLQQLEELVAMESPSHDKAAVDHCTRHFCESLRNLGVDITVTAQRKIGDLCFGSWPSSPRDAGGHKPFLVLVHADTVWPRGTIEMRPFQKQEDKIFGPGVLDMKAGMLMIQAAIETLDHFGIRPCRPICILISPCEETGSDEIDMEILKVSKSSYAALCLEPAIPGGLLKMERKGRMIVRLQAKGKSAHAGKPQEGINAIEELMQQLRLILRLRDNDITISPGKIEGGERINTVAENAWMELDIRFSDKVRQKQVHQYLHQLLPQIPGASIQCAILRHSDPMVWTEPSRIFFNQVRELAGKFNMKIEAGSTGGGSDAVIPSALGIPTLDGLGPDGDGIHAEHEHILWSSWIQRTVLLTEILQTF